MAGNSQKFVARNRAPRVQIEYDVELYKEMANFKVNELVQVSNRKGQRNTIQITNITRLSWQQLQLLVSQKVFHVI